MQLKGKKIWILSTIIVYAVSFLLESNFVLFQTRAQESNIPRVNIVAVLVDDQIYDSISSGLSRYTKNYVQQQLSDTKALVMPLNLDNISAYDIYRMMENVYFDGLENVNSSLIGLIMVGNIPLPVVNQNGYLFPTVYPYVDFENQKYVRDSDSNYFVPNGNTNGQAEIWHGLINYGDDTQAYLDFFQKVKKYYENPDGFIGDSMWYEDFIANKEGFINEYFQYYRNKIMFGEDLGYQRYSPLMKKILGNSSIDASLSILDNIQESAGIQFQGMDNDTINSVKNQGDGMHTTKIIQQEIQDSYLADYNELFSKIGLSRMRENIFAGGRWIKTYTDSDGQKSQIVNADSSSSMIQLKDTLYLGNDDLKGLIENLNDLMEDMVDRKIENEKYSMDIVIPVQLEQQQGKKAYLKCYTFITRYKNYYFGKEARYIGDPKELSIYRGTYRNLNSLNGVTYTSLVNGYNPPKSQNDNTNLRLKSIGASYDIFSSQVEGNRGYNNFLVSDDLDTFDANKSRTQEEEKTTCVQGLCTVRRKSRPSNCNDDDGNCEDLNEFATRWWGGASAINLKSDSIANGRYALSGYLATDSWRSIYDMGGFQALLPGNDEGDSGRGWVSGMGTGPQKAATSFKSYIKYASPTQTDGWNSAWWGYRIFTHHMPNVHTNFSNLNYLSLDSSIIDGWTFSSLADDMFSVSTKSKKGCGSSTTYTYKFLDSVIKHDSTTDDEINGIDYNKYSDTGELGTYYVNIVRSYDSVLNSIMSTLQDYAEITDILSGNRQTMLSRSGVYDVTGVNDAISIMSGIIASTQSGLSDLYVGISSLSFDEIIGVYEGIIYGMGGKPELYTGSYSSSLKKIGLLSGWMADISQVSSSIRSNGLTLISGYSSAINDIYSQMRMWKDYADDWKEIDGVSGTLVDAVTNNFSSDMFRVSTSEAEVTSGMSQAELEQYNSLTDEEKGLSTNLFLLRDTANASFLSSYTEVNNIYNNLVMGDTVGNTIVSVAKIDPYFALWLGKNQIQLDANDDAGWVITYSNWAVDEGSNTQYVKSYANLLNGVVIHEPGMNLLTPDRPIDSPRYISMQSIAGNEINLIYPNLFKVEVFRSSGQNSNGLDVHVLLSKEEIKENLIRYLSGKVSEYNTILRNEYNNALSNNSHFQKLKPFNVMATPDKQSRPYGYFTYDEFVEALGGEAMLDIIADMLYYQNLTNKKKLSSTSVEQDLDLIKQSFNINDKREEVLKDYLTEGNEKNPVFLIPSYEFSGYEVAYVNSNGNDYIVTIDNEQDDELSISVVENIDRNGYNAVNNQDLNDDSLDDNCNIPSNGRLPIFQLNGGTPSSPWYSGFMCWLDNLSAKVEINFDNAAGAIFTKGLSGFVDEVVGNTFSSWKNNVEDFGNNVEDFGNNVKGMFSEKESDSSQIIMERQMDADSHNQEVADGDDGLANAFAMFLRNVKISNSNSLLSDNNPVSELKISSIADVGNITVTFSSMGDGCLKVDNDGLCSGNQVSKTFNPKINPLTVLVSSSDHIAGSSALDLKIGLGSDYIEKILKYTVSPSELESVEVYVAEDKTIAGMLTPISIIGYDKYDNRVSRGLSNYDFVVSQGEFLKDGIYQTGFTTNDLRDLNFYYHAPLDALDNSEAIIQIVNSDDNGNILNTYRQRIVQASPEVTLDGFVALTGNNLRGNKTIRLSESDVNYSNVAKNNTSGLHVIEVKLKDNRGNIIDIDSQISVVSQNGLVVLGQIYMGENGYTKFNKTSLNYISGGVATIYYYPTNVAGDDTIIVNIPGLESRIIDLSILPSSWVNTEIVLEKDSISLGDTMSVEVFLSDKWGNLVDGLNTVSISYDEGKMELIGSGEVGTSNLNPSVFNLDSNVSGTSGFNLNRAKSLSGANSGNLNGVSLGSGMLNISSGSFVKTSLTRSNGILNLNVSGGYSKLQVRGIGAGLGYLVGGNSSVKVSIDKHLFPTSGLNIMYLNYFGDDWGNQWGYFSDHNKYIESLMKKSNKIITTTTQLISEDKIKRIVWKIDPGFKVWNPDNTNTSLLLKNGKINVKIGGITSANFVLPSLNWMSVNLDTMESVLGNSSNSAKNYVFFIPSVDEYSLRNGILFSGDSAILSIINGDIPLTLSSNKIFNGDNIWNVVDNGVNYGTIVFHLPNLIPSLSDFGQVGSRYVLNSTFLNGSTANMSSVGIFDTQSNFELDSSYESIQDSRKTEENIGFLGDFKNITLFAEGEIVGEATKKFGSEFVINLGDPVLSRKSNNENVYGTHYDGGIGQEIYADSENDIVNTYEIDFNNDGLKDLLVIYLDGSIKLAKNYGSTPDLRNLQELMRIAIPIKDVYVGDVDANNYDDIIIRTQNNQIRVYLNHQGIFDVDGNVACLNLNVYEGEISTSPSTLSGLHKFFVEDMDLDGVVDIVTYDHKGYIKIFYGGMTDGHANYLSTEKYACDTGWYEREVDNTQIVTALGVKLTSDRIYDNSMIRRVGMEKSDIEISENDLSDFGITINTNSLQGKIKKKDRNGDGDISRVMNEVMDNFDINKASEQFINQSLKLQNVSLFENKLVGGSGNIYTFSPISYLSPDSTEDKALVWKTYTVSSGRSILADGDIVTVRVTIQAKQSFVGSFGDIIQGPWKIYYDDNNIFEGIRFIQNQKNAVIKKRDGNFAYFVDNISLNAGELMIFEYDLKYKQIPLRDMDITYETSWSSDSLPDIKLQSVDGCVKDFDVFINQGGRAFLKDVVLLQQMIDDVYEETENNTENYADTVSQVGSDVNKLPGMVGDSIKRKSIIPSGKQILEDLLALGEGGISLNLDLSLFGQQAQAIENAIDDITKGMCNGFSFGGSNNCAGLPVPFNQAFLAPGKYNLFGCWDLPLGPLENGIPVFHFPGTITVPAPIPFPWGMKGPGDSFIWVPGGEYPSLIRIYAAPTLTAQLGLAICIGPYSVGKALPSPLADVGGNCIVFAIKPQCKKDGSNGGSQQDRNNPNETYSPIVEDVRDSGLCTISQKGPMITDKGYRSSPFDLYSYSSSTDSFNSLDGGSSFISSRSNFDSKETMQSVFGGNGRWYENMLNNVDVNGGNYNGTEYSTNFLGIINLETNASIGYFDENGNQNFGESLDATNSIKIGDVEILGGEFSINKIRGGIQQGLRKLLIDKWLDPQIRYIANQLTKMHINVKLPDFGGITDELKTLENARNNLGSMLSKDMKGISDAKTDLFGSEKLFNFGSGFWTGLVSPVSKWSNMTLESKDKFNSAISNPFETLASLMNQSNIFNISTETLVVKVPMIMPEDIASYGIYLQQWVDVNSQIIEDWRNAIDAFGLSCAKKEGSEKEKCYEDAQAAIASFVEFEQVDWQKMLDQIYTNIQILQKYRNFPFEMYERIHVMDRYMDEIASLISNTIGYLSYWVSANEERFVGYVDAIILIVNIIKTYQLIIDFSVERGQNCGNCANDTYDQYSCKLSLLCDAIELPIIQIPNFKIPNITLDLSNIDLGLDIILPKFNFQTIKVELPDLPNLPEPPTIGINIKLPDLPDIPQLPEPPELPELPSFIPEIELELPLLPPAPEIPRLPNKIESTIKLADYIGKIYCIVKGKFGLVGESSVKAKIEQLTQRTYEVKWIDNIMDFTNRMAAPIKNYGVDYEISSYVDLQFNFSSFYNFMDTVTKQINDLSATVEKKWLQKPSDIVQSLSNDLQNGIDGLGIDGNYDLNLELGYNGEMSDEIEYVDYVSAKNRLHEVLSYFRMEANNTTFADDLDSSIEKIENQIDTPSAIEANLDGIESVEQEIFDFIDDQNSEYKYLANLINDDYEGFLAMIDNHEAMSGESGSDSEKLLTYNVQLFNLDGSTRERLERLKNQNPYMDLLNNKKDIVDGYWNAIISNTASDLGLSQSQYLVLRNGIGNMKEQVATMYSIVKPTQSVNLIAKDTNKTTQKTMVVANSASLGKNISSLGGNTETTISVDPQVFTQGIYEKLVEGDEAGERLTKVVYSDSFAQDIGKRYYHTTHFSGHDTILWTTNAIYKKCVNQNCANGGNHFNGYYMRYVDSIPYEKTLISFDSDTKLKIADVKNEVKNFKVKGQTYDGLSFSWQLDDVDAYLIKLVERVDYSYEKADYTDNSVRSRYVLALPNGMDLDTLQKNNIKLEILKNRIDFVANLYSGDLIEVVNYDIHKAGDITISNIDRKRYYLRIVALKLNGDTYNIVSPRSNQIVAGRQVVGDDLSPLGNAELYRPSVKEIVSEGNDLQGYVGTKYKLNVLRKDNVALSYINISKDGYILDEKYTSKSEDSVSVNVDIHAKEGVETYSTVGVDQFGNETHKNITVTYGIPNIDIVDISENSDGETVSIIAELSQDVDQGSVSFQRRRGNIRKTMKRKDAKYGDVMVKPGQTTVIGGPYTVGKDIAFYDTNDNLMALMDPNTAEIKIQSGYNDLLEIKVTVQNSAVLQMYKVKTNNLVFSISVPIKELVKIDAGDYTVKDLPNNGKMGMFNGGKVVYRDGENVLFISPTGHLYSEIGLEGTYDYDRELQAMVLTLYQLSDFNKKNPIKIRLKVDPFVAQ